MTDKPYTDALELLKQLIATPSLSGEEEGTAALLFDHLQEKGLNPQRYKNNVWTCCKHFDPAKPTLLLNSHHDTVAPSPDYTRNPFEPAIEDGKLYGLGSNDAGASVVSLIEAYAELSKQELSYNLVIAITAEEERIGINGISALWGQLPTIDFAIVGEPTLMQAAIAERGLMVLDGVAKGVSGHAARNEGDNALYHAIDDIQWIRSYQFPKESPLMGRVKMTVTQIQAGTQHNSIPAECKFVVDVRPTDCYSNEEILAEVKAHISANVTARSTHLRASSISQEHPLVKTAVALGMERYVSPTSSDITRLPVPALKLGVGNSARSHTADEFIYIEEVKQGITTYSSFLKELENHIDLKK